MIWNFLEVWLLVAIVFVIGCVIGSYLYGWLADSRLALVQGALADQVGDVVDRIKVVLGVGPAWRPGRARPTGQPKAKAKPRPGRVADVLPSPYVEAEAPRSLTSRDFEAPMPRLQPAPERPDTSIPEQAPDWRDEADSEAGEFAETDDLASSLPREQPSEEDWPDEANPMESGDPARLVSARNIASDGVVPARPPGLSRPRGSVPDNLTRIRGVGERNETLLNSLGIFHFGQIAAWTPGEARWIGQYLAFPERIERDDWVGQAMILAAGGDTGFEKSADRRRRRRAERRQTAMARELSEDVADIMGRRKPSPAKPRDDDEGSPSGDG